MQPHKICIVGTFYIYYIKYIYIIIVGIWVGISKPLPTLSGETISKP